MSSPAPAASSSAQPHADGPAEGRRHLVVIPLAGLVAVLPLIAHGCSCGHDFDFHLLNWMEAARQFSHGNLHPHWAFSPAFNAGEPRFVFYPPLSWYLGALLGLLLTHLPGVSVAAGWNATPIVFTWIALTLSGLTLHRLAREYLSANAALLAATIYLANPYMLFTAYERTAYAELLAAAWIPLVFHAILRERVTIPRIAPPMALLWLTNAPAAVMGTYALALLSAIRLATASRKTQVSEARPGAPASNSAPTQGAPHLVSEMWESRRSSAMRVALNAVAGTFLGLALAAFYIVHAAYERRFVQIAMATIAGMRFDNNFLFEQTGNTPDELLHDAVLHTASLIAIILLIATAAALVAMFFRGNGKYGRHPDRSDSQHYRGLRSGGTTALAFPIVPFAILATAITFLLTPLSTPIWRHAPEMAFLQFPWRLLAILAPIFALSIAAIFTKSPAIPSFKASPPADKSPGAPSFAPLRRVGRNPFAIPFATTLLAVALTLPAYHFFHQPCDPEDTAPARLALFHSNAGTDPTDEYTPTTADNDALQPDNPPYWLADSAKAAAATTDENWAAVPITPMHFAVNAPHPEELILNLRDYPAWSIAVNGAPIPTRHPRPDGLIAIPIPAGPSTIDIRYAHMPDQTIGDAITLLALPLFLFTLRSKRRAHS